MKSTELKEKLKAANEKVTKIEGTIKNHHNQALKKLAEIHKRGYNENDRYCMQGTEQQHDAYWLICEYSHKLEDEQNAKRKLEDAQRIAENWEAKYKAQVKLENTIAFEMPEIFAQCKTDLADEWTKYDIESREKMIAKRMTMGYKEFRKIYKYSDEMNLSKSNEEFMKANLRDAEAFIIDLYNRVKAITGEVIDWSHIRYKGKALNGIVVGKNGKVNVETILAGGYNIQRLHYRVLVHEIK